MRAILSQEYRDYEVVFVTESENDPAYETLSRLLKHSRRPGWMVVAGEAKNQGQKVHNLCAAIDTSLPLTTVVVEYVGAPLGICALRQSSAQITSCFGCSTWW